MRLDWDAQGLEATHHDVWLELFRQDHLVFRRLLTASTGIAENVARDWIDDPQVVVTRREEGEPLADLFVRCLNCFLARIVVEVKVEADFSRQTVEPFLVQTVVYRHAFTSGANKGCRCWEPEAGLPAFVVLDGYVKWIRKSHSKKALSVNDMGEWTVGRTREELEAVAGLPDEDVLEGWVTLTYGRSTECDDESGLAEYLMGIRTSENGGV